MPKSVAAVDVGGGAAAVTSAERAGLKAADANVEPGTLMAELRHAQVDDIPVDVFLTDPGLALVHADMTAYLEAHPCVCEALCECDKR